MKFTIGKEEPEEFDIVHITLAQILILNPNHAAYMKEGAWRIFESDVDWIPIQSEMKRMLDGGLVPYIKFGANSSRVETSYRFCYKDIIYGDRISNIRYQGSDPTINFEEIAIKPDMHYLALGNFGRFHWD